MPYRRRISMKGERELIVFFITLDLEFQIKIKVGIRGTLIDF